VVATDMATLRLRYVKGYIDRYGKARHYFRKPGCKAVPLPGLPGSTEFMAAYQAALGTPPPVSREHKPGSIAALIVDYLRSPAFSNLKLSAGVSARARPVRHGDRMVHDMPRSAAAAYIHQIGAERPAMANITRSILRKLLSHAVRLGQWMPNASIVSTISLRRSCMLSTGGTGK
jgi:hypothetical protein